ncbi:hypothetical protein ACXYMO_10175 [Arenibacterium sp. CAU 1754]
MNQKSTVAQTAKPVRRVLTSDSLGTIEANGVEGCAAILIKWPKTLADSEAFGQNGRAHPVQIRA